MTFNEVKTAIADEKMVGFTYQRRAKAGFRDRFTVYKDGKIFFERFCYGEAAGPVFDMWAYSVGDDGTVEWDYDSCLNSNKMQAPVRLSGGDVQSLEMDEKTIPWDCVIKLKKDPKNGYGGILGFFKAFKK